MGGVRIHRGHMALSPASATHHCLCCLSSPPLSPRGPRTAPHLATWKTQPLAPTHQASPGRTFPQRWDYIVFNGVDPMAWMHASLQLEMNPTRLRRGEQGKDRGRAHVPNRASSETCPDDCAASTQAHHTRRGAIRTGARSIDNRLCDGRRGRHLRRLQAQAVKQAA